MQYSDIFLGFLTIALALQVQSEEAPAAFIMGNGSKDQIKTESISRDGKIVTLNEVYIDGDGQMVMHSSKEDAPNGDKYMLPPL